MPPQPFSFQHIRSHAAVSCMPGPRGRYAPSPSGPLHLGNFRTALLSWLQARLTASHFLLRMEDLDLPRMKSGCDITMMKELNWLGLTWDEGAQPRQNPGRYFQAQRTHIYQAALAYLRQENRVYRCYCSRKDILQAASAPHGHQGSTPYPGTCRHLTPSQEAAMVKAKPGRKPSWRFKAPAKTIHFEDQITGRFSQCLHREVGDFVVKRSDGLFAYQLAVVVDDGLMGVSDVLRGVDLLDSTPRQIALFEALHLPVPTFWHVPLVCDPAGARLAKRDGAAGLAIIREQGHPPNQIIGMLAASLGWVSPGKAISAKALLSSLSLSQFQTSLRNPANTPQSLPYPL